MPVKTITHEEVKKELLADPEFRRFYDEMTPKYIRKKKRIAKVLAAKRKDSGIQED